MASYIWRDYEHDKVYVKSDAGETIEVPNFVHDAYMEIYMNDHRTFRETLLENRELKDANERLESKVKKLRKRLKKALKGVRK